MNRHLLSTTPDLRKVRPQSDIARRSPWVLLILCGVTLFPVYTSAQELPFTAEQSANGKTVYQEHCQLCHGNNLSNGQFGTPLRGSYFRKNWAGKTAAELLRFTREEMPPEAKGSLPDADYAAALAYILSRNDLLPGLKALPDDPATLQSVLLPW